MYTIDLSGKTVLISGGCGAIRRVIVRVLADAGASVAVNDIVSEAEAATLLQKAGVNSPRATYFREDAATVDGVGALNVRAPFLLARTAAQHWLSSGVPGQLIFTTSWVQDVPWPEITPYTAGKAALKAMMRGFARELAPHGIQTNAVAPGIVAVGLAKRQWDTDPTHRARAAKAILLGFMQPPETVAHAFLFLCSDLAAYMTGAVLLVDGGCSLYPMD